MRLTPHVAVTKTANPENRADTYKDSEKQPTTHLNPCHAIPMRNFVFLHAEFDSFVKEDRGKNFFYRRYAQGALLFPFVSGNGARDSRISPNALRRA